MSSASFFNLSITKDELRSYWCVSVDFLLAAVRLDEGTHPQA